MLTAHFAVPLVGAVIVAINTRLASEEIRYILDHSGATLLVVDAEYAGLVEPIMDSLETVRTVAIATDPSGRSASTSIGGMIDFSRFLAEGQTDRDELTWTVIDERAPLAINYTSGTTGRPKGVVYTHRGAYLNSLGKIFHSEHGVDSVYLWTLPMFHCNGWCTIWALVAAGGTQICLRDVRAPQVWDAIDRHGVTHLNGAPTVITTILYASDAHNLETPVTATVAGAPPSPTTMAEAEAMGFKMVHVYRPHGTYGPYTVCVFQESWRRLSAARRAENQARQGVAMIQADRVRVVERNLTDGELVDVPADGRTMGEVVMRGNNVMQGYYRDAAATAEAFAGGWFHSGDLGVMHPDGYVELRDRAKDVIVSGGENIATIEVEQAIASHPDVLEVAVIGVPDDRWGERPKAFVIPRAGQSPTPEDILGHVQSRIARYKAPREVVVVESLPKTSTGKIQKFELREREWSDEQRQIRG